MMDFYQALTKGYFRQFSVMLKYKLVTKKATLGKHKDNDVQQAQMVLSGNVSFDKLCEALSHGSTVGKADVKAVLSQMSEKIAEFLDLGMSVDCGDLGIFRPSFSSEQVPVGEKFTAEHLRKPKIVFTPRKDFKDCLKNAKFEKIN